GTGGSDAFRILDVTSTIASGIEKGNANAIVDSIANGVYTITDIATQPRTSDTPTTDTGAELQETGLFMDGWYNTTPGFTGDTLHSNTLDHLTDGVTELGSATDQSDLRGSSRFLVASRDLRGQLPTGSQPNNGLIDEGTSLYRDEVLAQRIGVESPPLGTGKGLDDKPLPETPPPPPPTSAETTPVDFTFPGFTKLQDFAEGAANFSEDILDVFKKQSAQTPSHVQLEMNVLSEQGMVNELTMPKFTQGITSNRVDGTWPLIQRLAEVTDFATQTSSTERFEANEERDLKLAEWEQAMSIFVASDSVANELYLANLDVQQGNKASLDVLTATSKSTWTDRTSERLRTAIDQFALLLTPDEAIRFRHRQDDARDSGVKKADWFYSEITARPDLMVKMDIQQEEVSNLVDPPISSFELLLPQSWESLRALIEPSEVLHGGLTDAIRNRNMAESEALQAYQEFINARPADKFDLSTYFIPADQGGRMNGGDLTFGPVTGASSFDGLLPYSRELPPTFSKPVEGSWRNPADYASSPVELVDDQATTAKVDQLLQEYRGAYSEEQKLKFFPVTAPYYLFLSTTASGYLHGPSGGILVRENLANLERVKDANALRVSYAQEGLRMDIVAAELTDDSYNMGVQNLFFEFDQIAAQDVRAYETLRTLSTESTATQLETMKLTAAASLTVKKELLRYAEERNNLNQTSADEIDGLDEWNEDYQLDYDVILNNLSYENRNYGLSDAKLNAVRRVMALSRFTPDAVTIKSLRSMLTVDEWRALSDPTYDHTPVERDNLNEPEPGSTESVRRALGQGR
ncbi:MAG: hypothetical protein ACRCYU_06785, partial [Nocardioides sp.]